MGRKKRKKRTLVPWTEDEVRILKANWKQVSARVLADLLRRHKWSTIYHRASKLGLPFGAPQGYETLEQAAIRAGYTSGSLKNLLKRHRVMLWHGYKEKSAEASSRIYVEPDDVDMAVTTDIRLQSIRTAAARLHVSQQRLSKALKARGQYIATGQKGAMIRPEVFDEIVTDLRKERAA